MKIFIIIRKDLINRIVIKKRSDLVDHLYLIILDIKDLNQKIRIPIRRIRVMNVYDQVIGREYTYLEAYVRRRRTIKDISWNRIIIEKTVFISDFNAYSLKWNFTCENLIGTRLLKELLIKFNLIIINEKGMLIRRLLKKIFIIDLVIIAPNMRNTII